MFDQRLKEMKQMQRDPLASSKARKAERKADEKSGLITIKPVKLDMQPSGGGFKKGGFKNAFGEDEDKKDVVVKEKKGGFKKVVGAEELEKVTKAEESDTDDEYEYYDPRRPTECYEGCAGR